MKAVILTCSTGQGHNSAGRAVGQALEKRGVVCETRDALAFLGERASGLIAGAFVGIAVKTPRAFGFMYQAGEKLSDGLGDRLKSPVYYGNALYADNLGKYLEENAIDAAVCPHLFPAEALTYLKKRGKLKTKCYFVSTDYTCIPFLEETAMDCVFTPDIWLESQFTSRGMPKEMLRHTGVPVSSRFSDTLGKTAARAEFGIPKDVPAFLVMTGGEGCGDAMTLTRLLTERLGASDARIVVLPGHNEKLGNEIDQAFAFDERVLVMPFTNSVPELMDACDIVLTKPGGISSTEAAVKRIPIIHTPPIPGCETLNARYFADRGMSILASDENSAADNALRLALDARQRERMSQAQAQYIRADSADNIAEIVCEG